MYCRDCSRYDTEEKRCKDGKLNPERYSQAVEVTKVFGLRSICTFNDHREQLVAVQKSPASNRR